jgi:hypothetical protein
MLTYFLSQQWFVHFVFLKTAGIVRVTLSLETCRPHSDSTPHKFALHSAICASDYRRRNSYWAMNGKAGRAGWHSGIARDLCLEGAEFDSASGHGPSSGFALLSETQRSWLRQVPDPMRWMDLFSWPNLSSQTMARARFCVRTPTFLGFCFTFGDTQCRWLRQVPDPMRWKDLFSWPNLSSRTRPWGLLSL